MEKNFKWEWKGGESNNYVDVQLNDGKEDIKN